MARTLSPSTLDRIAQAYELLNVTHDQVRCAPQITPQLAMIEKTLKRGGQDKVTRKILRQDGPVQLVEDVAHFVPYGPGSDLRTSWAFYLSMSDHADARKVHAVYHSLPHHLRRHTPIEAFCVAAGVAPHSILEILVALCVRTGAQATSIIAAVNQPRVVQKSVEMALTDEGFDDRELLARATGFLPTPKSAQTTISIQTNATAQAAAAPVIPIAAPPPEQTTRRLATKLNEMRGLPAAPPADTFTPPVLEREPVTIDADYEDIDDDDGEE